MSEERREAASDETPIRVAVVDDHESVRLGLRSAFRDAGHEVVAEAAHVSALEERLGGAGVEVVILDLSLGDGSSVGDNVRRIMGLGAGVLVHSIADRVAPVREALAAGAAGVVPKSAAACDVIDAAVRIARGEVLTNLEWASAIDADPEFTRAQLAPREREILNLYASGLPLKIAAQQLGIGYSTAREYIDRIRVKYVEVGRPAPTKVDLLRRAVEDGILPGLDADGPDGR